MALILVLTFIAGVLTILAPCILPMLPIIVGGSFSTQKNKLRPYVITMSLLVSILVFTLLLKASTVLIKIDLQVWSYISGVLIVALGTTMLLPHGWEALIGRLGLQSRAQKLLGDTNKIGSEHLSAIATGAALGPVFTSCSPTYAWVLATVLPRNIWSGLLYLIVYCSGLALALLVISLVGRKLISKLNWASRPDGIFHKVIAILFVIVGLSIATGVDKSIQSWLASKDYLHLIRLEQKLVPEDPVSKQDSQPEPTSTQPTTMLSFGLNNMADFIKDSTAPPSGKWSVSGSWTQDEEGIISIGSDAVLYLHPDSQKLYISAQVVQPGSFNDIEAYDGAMLVGKVQISRQKKYEVANSSFGNVLTLKVPSGVKITEAE